MVSPEKSFAAQMSEPPLQAHSTPKTNGNPHRKSLGDGGHRHNDGGVTVAVRLRPLFGAEREGGATEVSRAYKGFKQMLLLCMDTFSYWDRKQSSLLFSFADTP
jgi:hypothetical protein